MSLFPPREHTEVASDLPFVELGAEPEEPQYRPFLALLLLEFAAVTWFGFQCYQLLKVRDSIETTFASQTRQFEDSGKMRRSFDALAHDTAMLAAQGNVGAKHIVDDFTRRGVTLDALPVTVPPK